MIQFRVVLFIALAIVSMLLFPARADAQQQCPARERSARQLTAYETAGHPPGEARRVEALLSCYQSLVTSVSAQLGLSQRQLNAALAAFAFRNPKLKVSQLPSAISDLAKQNVELNRSLQAAKAQIAVLENAELRTSGDAALERVQRLLEAGNFGGAADALNSFQLVSATEIRAINSVIASVERARAQAAFAQGDIDGARSFIDAAVNRRALQLATAQQALSGFSEFNRQEALWGYLQHADALINRGTLFGRNAELSSAITVLENDAGPLTSREKSTYDWAEVQTRIGAARTRIGEREEGIENLNQAEGIFRAILSEYPQSVGVRNNLAATLMHLGDRLPESTKLAEASREFSRILREINPETERAAFGSAAMNSANVLFSMGQNMLRWGQTEDGLQMLENAESHYKRALGFVDKG